MRRNPDHYAEAIATFAIATAVLGFGLFNIEFIIGPSLLKPTLEAFILSVSPNPPNGVVEMEEQGIRDLEERLSR